MEARKDHRPVNLKAKQSLLERNKAWSGPSRRRRNRRGNLSARGVVQGALVQVIEERVQQGLLGRDTAGRVVHQHLLEQVDAQVVKGRDDLAQVLGGPHRAHRHEVRQSGHARPNGVVRGAQGAAREGGQVGCKWAV